MVYIALFAAVVAALGVMPPINLAAVGVPITAQTLGVMLAGGILGARRGALAMVLFLLLVAVGLPLLAGGRGGLGVFFGPSGGFVLGWVATAWVIGLLVERFWSWLTVVHALLACVGGGVVVLYAIGIPWVAWAADLTLRQAFVGSLAFVPGDLVKAVIAAWVIVIVRRSYPLISGRREIR